MRAGQQETFAPAGTVAAWWRNPWFGAAAIAGLVLAVYWSAFGSGFTWDDNILFTDNPMNKLGDGWLRVWYQKPSDAAPDYYPVTYTLIWLQYQIWGAAPAGYHAVSILLHIVNCLLLWRVLKALGVSVPWLVAALFAVHPVNVPSVAWAAEQKNTLGMLFYLGVALAYLRFEDDGKPRWYAAALGLFALGLLCKTTLVVLPAVLLLLAWWRRGGITMRDLLRSLPFWGLAILGGVVTMLFQYRPNGGMPLPEHPLLIGCYTAGKSVWFYILRDLWPAGNCALLPAPWNPWTPYGYRTLNPADYLPLVMVAATAGGLWWAAGKKAEAWWARPAFFAFAYFLLSMGPLLGFFPTLYLQYSPVADHWQYLSVMSIIALQVCAGAWLVRRLAWGPTPVAGASRKRKKNVERERAEAGVSAVKPLPFPAIASGVVAGAAVLFALACLSRAFVWSYGDNTRVWRNVIAKNPAAWLAYSNYGRDLAQANNLREAALHFEKAVELHPWFTDALHNACVVYMRQGEWDKAASMCERAIQAKGMTQDWLLLGQLRARQKRHEDAAACFDEALRRDGRSFEGLFGLAMMRAAMGHAGEAVAKLRELRDAVPQHVVVCNALAWLLATSPEAEVRDPQEALALAESNVAAVGADPLALDTLAAAQAASGDCARSAETARQALAAAERSGQFGPEELARMKSRFRLYDSGKPYVAGKGDRLQTENF